LKQFGELSKFSHQIHTQMLEFAQIKNHILLLQGVKVRKTQEGLSCVSFF